MTRIKNWNRFQHFKDRRPPWIKLYRELLDDIEWHNLDANAAKALVMLWLIASENDGELPAIRQLAFRLRITERQMIQIVSDLSHYLEQADINPISTRYQDDAPETETETETERETEAERKPSARPSRLPENWQPAQSEWDWVAVALPRLDAKAETEKFRDHFLANGKPMAKWAHAWRNWMRRAITYQKSSGSSPQPVGFLDRYKQEIEEQRMIEEQEVRHVRALGS